MYNLRLIGGRLDHINIRVSFAVIGIFTIITIVSYFYELSRAGLLSRHAQYHPRFPHLHREAREITEPAPGQLSRHPLHQLGSQIESIKDTLRLRNTGEEKQEFNIAVHLGKNNSYTKVNNTSFNAYQHQNTQPNFYTTSCLTSPSDQPISDACVRNLTARAKAYNNATQVLVYQHEPGGYFMRDCFRSVAQKAGKGVADVPLNSAKREEWDHIGNTKKKSSVSILYGGLSFGVCETVDQPCMYLTFLSHPITRILTLYDICSRNRSNPYCKINGLHQSNVTLDNFIHSQRSNLFHKLLYNHRHCKLVGQDEICLPDSGTSFVLSQNEKEAYLDDIVENLEHSFGVVGLIDYLYKSLNMFEVALGLEFSKCVKWDEFDKYNNYVQIVRDELSDQFFIREYWRVSRNSEYLTLKESLENNSEVKQLLHADLVIYAKLEEIFQRQMKAYDLHEHLKRVKRSDDQNQRIEEKLIAERHLSRKMTEYESVENLKNVADSSSTEDTSHIPRLNSQITDCDQIKFDDSDCHHSLTDVKSHALNNTDKLNEKHLSTRTEDASISTTSSTSPQDDFEPTTKQSVVLPER